MISTANTKVNLLAMAVTIKHALPVMRKQKEGGIVNILSGAAVMAMPILGYSCTKLGVHALTQHVAGAGGPDGVCCNCVMVGAVGHQFKRVRLGISPTPLYSSTPMRPASSPA